MYRVGILGCDDLSLFDGMVLVLDLCIRIYIYICLIIMIDCVCTNLKCVNLRWYLYFGNCKMIQCRHAICEYDLFIS